MMTHLHDVVYAPDQRKEEEHHQTARVIILGQLHLGQVQPLGCTLQHTHTKKRQSKVSGNIILGYCSSEKKKKYF